MMKGSIDFYYDYSSPYGYLASERIEAIARKHDHSLVWRPILLGAVFKVTGQGPLTQAPLKGDYAIRDFTRSAREHSLDYRQPDKFPIGAVSASRATLWLRDNEDENLRNKTAEFIHGTYRAYFAEGKDITDPAVLADLAESAGIDAPSMADAVADQQIKDLLRVEVESAIEIGVFGSPTMIVNGEQFWGHDRLEQLDRWISTGGW